MIRKSAKTKSVNSCVQRRQQPFARSHAAKSLRSPLRDRSISGFRIARPKSRTIVKNEIHSRLAPTKAFQVLDDLILIIFQNELSARGLGVLPDGL